MDTASLSVLAVAGLEEPDTIDMLLALAVDAVEGDSQLGGAVQYARPVEHAPVADRERRRRRLLTAELALEIRM